MENPDQAARALSELCELAEKSGAPIEQVRSYAKAISASLLAAARRLSGLIKSNRKRSANAIDLHKRAQHQVRSLMSAGRSRAEAVDLVAKRQRVSRSTVYRALAEELRPVAQRTARLTSEVEGNHDA